jgi:hypothetical protein
MYQLFHELSVRQLLARQLPVIVASFAIAEVF